MANWSINATVKMNMLFLYTLSSQFDNLLFHEFWFLVKNWKFAQYGHNVSNIIKEKMDKILKWTQFKQTIYWSE